MNHNELAKLQSILSFGCRKKKYNIMIDGQNFFDQPVRNNLIIYERSGVNEMITQLVVS